jgi:tRNA-splicing ligase RtcB
MAPRQSARRADVEEFNELRVVTKIDPRMCRRDIADEYRKSLLEEAPSMYKPTLPAIDTLVNAGIANKVARVWPLMTIKGL